MSRRELREQIFKMLFRIEFQWSAVHGVRGSLPAGNEKSLHGDVQGSFQDGTSPTWSGIFPVF